MISYIIENTDNRFSIREDGQVQTHYNIDSYQNKTYVDNEFVSKYRNSYSSPTYVVGLRINGIKKVVSVNKLMMKYFNLKKPDSHHLYHLIPKDGNHKNHSLSNLIWKMRLDRKYEYPIDVFYDEQGIITHQRCGCCGNVFLYEYFRKHNNHSSARKNICRKCTDKERHIVLRSTQENIDRTYKSARRFLLSEKGRVWLKKHLQNDRDKLANWYIDVIIKKKYSTSDIITDELREVVRLQVQLNREIKFQKQL